MTPDTSTREFVAVPREATKSVIEAMLEILYHEIPDQVPLSDDLIARVYRRAVKLSTVPASPQAKEKQQWSTSLTTKIETAIGGAYEFPDARKFWIDGPVAREITRRVCAAIQSVPAAPVAGEDARPRIYELKKKALELGQGDYDTWPAEQRLGFDCGVAVAEWPMPPVIDDAAVERFLLHKHGATTLAAMRGSHTKDADKLSKQTRFAAKFERTRAALHAAFPTGEE